MPHNDDGPECPHCRHVHEFETDEEAFETDWPWADNDPMTCDGCGKEFLVTAIKSVSWETQSQE